MQYTDNPVADADAYLAECEARQAAKDEFIDGQVGLYWDEAMSQKGCERLAWDHMLDQGYPEMLEIIADHRRSIENGSSDKEAALQELGRQMIAFVARQFNDKALEDWENRL